MKLKQRSKKSVAWYRRELRNIYGIAKARSRRGRGTAPRWWRSWRWQKRRRKAARCIWNNDGHLHEMRHGRNRRRLG